MHAGNASVHFLFDPCLFITCLFPFVLLLMKLFQHGARILPHF